MHDLYSLQGMHRVLHQLSIFDERRAKSRPVGGFNWRKNQSNSAFCRECGCGEGDSGCSACGCCRICAREVVDNSELADLAGMMRLDLIFRDKVLIPPRQRTKLQEQVSKKQRFLLTRVNLCQLQIQSRLEERKNRGRKSGAGPSKQATKVKSMRPVVSGTPTHRSSNNPVRQCNVLGTGLYRF
jgi:hypothetical protein